MRRSVCSSSCAKNSASGPADRSRLILDKEMREVLTHLPATRVVPIDSTMTASKDGAHCFTSRLLAEHSRERPGVPVTEKDPGVRLYTSGSSGRPKGMVQSGHGSLVRFLERQRTCLQLDEQSCMASIAPMGFDVKYCELFGALCCGACVAIARRNQRSPGRTASSNFCTRLG